MINQTIETAFRVLLYLATEDSKRLASLQEIHEAVGGSPTYLAKVTASLSRGGLIDSQRGAQGGLRIGRAPKKITALEVIEACQGPYVPFEPQESTGKNKFRNYHAVAEELNTLVTKAMGKITLDKMMSGEAKPFVEEKVAPKAAAKTAKVAPKAAKAKKAGKKK